jgi:hypothetical protein
MTQYFPFSPNILVPYQFSPTIDGQLANAYVVWSLFGKRYYLTLTDLSGVLIVSLPVIGTENAIPLQGLEWADGIMTGTIDTSVVQGIYFPPGTTIDLVIKGCTPAGYGGKRRCLITNQTQFQYQAPFIGIPTIYGQVSHDVNIIGGYAKNSAVIFRQGSQTFEVDP